MTDIVEEPAPVIRAFGDDLWSVVELGERFSKGYYIYGSAPALFRTSVSALCIDVLSQDVSKTPIELRKRTPTGSEVVLPVDHPAAALLARPSRFYGYRAFMRMLVTNLVTASEYYVAVDRDRKGKPREMQGIPKRLVSATVNVKKRRYFYDVSPGTLHDQAQFGWAGDSPMSDEDMVHLVTRTANGFDAIATQSIAGATLGLLQQMQEYQTGLFNNGGMPVMAFKFPMELTTPQFDRLKSDFTKAAAKARRDGTPIILEGADGKVADIEKISLSSVDTEFIKANESAGLDAARYFRVPPHKVYLLASVKYDNQSEQERVYVDDALVPIFNVIEEGLESILLDEDERKDYFIRFDKEKAYAQAPEERHKIVNERWKTGQIDYDEMRTAIGLNTVGGDEGRVRMFSGNFVLVGKDNEVIMRAGGNAPDQTGDGSTPAKKKTAEPFKPRLVE